jgi:putative spermidine/putrescine transport system substrate-binding protein
MSSSSGEGLTRRELLARGGTAAAALAALGGFPEAAAAGRGERGAFTGTLRVLGIGDGQSDPIRRRAQQDLGFKIAFHTTGADALVHRAITEPASFDVLAYYYFVYDLIWSHGAVQPVDTGRIVRWRQVNDLFKYGKVRPGDPRCTYGQGDAPFRCMYVDESGRYPVSPDVLPEAKTMVQWIDERSGKPHRGLPEPRYVSAVPIYFNSDSIGYNARVIRRPPERVSWAELFNAKWKGRVALFSGAQIGLLDAGNAAEAAGLIRFRDKGNMARGEIDRIVKLLVKLKKQGHFHGFWNELEAAKAIEFMLSKEVVVESMWAFHVAKLQEKGFPVRYAAPPEGYRG